MRRFAPFRIRVPGSTANLGAGFDCLGMAVTLHNTVDVRTGRPGSRGIEYVITGEGAQDLGRTGRRANLFDAALRATLGRLGLGTEPALSVRMANRIPLGRGLGSSGAAALAGIAAAFRIAGRRIEPAAVLREAMAIEGHPDNLVPSLLGGATAACAVGGEVAWARIRIGGALGLVAVIPRFEVQTKLARRALPSAVPHADAVHNVGRACLLVAALAAGRLDLVPLGLDDRLHQPYRARLVPGLDELLDEARRLGAAGAFLSGAGPTLMALVPGGPEGAARARAVGEGLVRVWHRRFRIESAWRLLRVDRRGLGIEGIRPGSR